MITFSKSTKGRVLFMGGTAYCTFALSPDWDMPNCAITKTASWQELNKGKKSKRQRRG